MIFRKLAASVAVAALIAAAPAMAQASSAQSLSVAKSVPQGARVGAPMRGANKQLEGTALYVVGAIAVGLAIYGIIELTSDDNNDDSDSP